MKYVKLLLLGALLGLTVTNTQARDRIRLDTTIIKGNREMPQIVYIVPWKDMKNQHLNEQTLVLHSLFGDTFNPVHARDIQAQKLAPALSERDK